MEQWGNAIADIFVAIGVAGEVGFARWAALCQSELARRSGEKVAEANKIAAQANEATAQLRKHAAILQHRLESDRKYREARTLSDQQKSAMIQELRGKLHTKVVLWVQVNLEARKFALEIVCVLQDAGVTTDWQNMPPGEVMFFPAGILIYKPGGENSEEDMKDDPLYLALKRAKIFGGHASIPALPTMILDAPRLSPLYHILYIGQKNP